MQDGAAALDAVHLLWPDVVVLDISMPGKSGLDVARPSVARDRRSEIALLTMHNEPELVEAAQAAGGIGYVLKARLSSDLTIAIGQPNGKAARIEWSARPEPFSPVRRTDVRSILSQSQGRIA